MKLTALELSCRSSRLSYCLQLFTERLGYSVVGSSRKSGVHVLQLKNTWFVFRPNDVQERVEYVSELVFHVANVEKMYASARANGGEIVEALSSFHCECGVCNAFTVQSPFPSITHTFTDCPAYPLHHFAATEPDTFNSLSDCDNSVSDWKTLLMQDVDCIDHVTFVSDRGESRERVSWYQRVLGFKRFHLHSSETSDGYSINCDTNGLKMLALEYYKCAEVCVSLEGVKLVFGEGLPGPGPNQCVTFVKGNGGPGVQHVAYHTRDLFSTATLIRDHGQAFLQPPIEYYSQIEKLTEIPSVGHSREDLWSLGILLDKEEEGAEEEEEDGSSTEGGYSYLMQVFTETLFDTETFFLEYIQRNGAIGFGTRNIVALWKAVQAHLQAQQQQ